VTASSPGIVARLLRIGLRRHVRGSTRLAFTLARRVGSLRAVPISIAGRTLYVDLRDGLSHDMLAGSPWSTVPWEASEQEVMRRLVRPGDVALDIGAHIGLHLVLLADLVGPPGRVHAFEPNPHRLHALAMTVAALPNATLHPVGLADRTGRSTLFVPGDESMASLADWTEGRTGRVEHAECDVRRLDDMVGSGEVDRPAFIKCDVEGAELRVFGGARETLDRPDAPIILYEANARSAAASGADVSAATRFLTGLASARYSIRHVQSGGRLVPVDRLDPSQDHFNLVAIPAARGTP
jgi:FkbM family methyltransferase